MTLDLEAWFIARRSKEKPWEVLGISRMHAYRIQTAAMMPSHDLAARIAALMVEDGIATTAGAILDHQAARIAARVGDKGASIWPHAPWAKIQGAKP